MQWNCEEVQVSKRGWVRGVWGIRWKEAIMKTSVVSGPMTWEGWVIVQKETISPRKEKNRVNHNKECWNDRYFLSYLIFRSNPFSYQSYVIHICHVSHDIHFADWWALLMFCYWTISLSSLCHIHEIALSSTPDLRSRIHQLRSTFAQLAVRTLWTSLYISLHYVPCTFDPSGLDSLLAFHRSCVRLRTQLRLYFSSISAFVRIWV